jgi:hypothetical protein
VVIVAHLVQESEEAHQVVVVAHLAALAVAPLVHLKKNETSLEPLTSRRNPSWPLYEEDTGNGLCSTNV